METCDVLIVGGGPAGSTCARELREAGLDVVVWDRASFPRDKPCAGWITPTVLTSLALAPDEYGAARTLQPFLGFRTGRVGGPWVETRYERPVGFGILRSELDDFLLRRSGARLRTGAPVRTLRRDGGSWVVNEELRAPLLVGAGGHFCPVARVLNDAATPASSIVARDLEFTLPADARSPVAPEIPHLYFTRDLAGYGWCVRKRDVLNVGLGRRGASGFEGHVRAFLAFVQEQGLVPRELPDRWRGHAYLLYTSAPRRIFDDGVLLIGDAAGLATPASGEGIRPAVESGLLAAAAILEAGGRYSREALASYGVAIERDFGRRQRGWTAPPRLAEALGTLLFGSRLFARHVLLDRWFLGTGQAPTRAARLSVRSARPSGAPAARSLGTRS